MDCFQRRISFISKPLATSKVLICNNKEIIIDNSEHERTTSAAINDLKEIRKYLGPLRNYSELAFAKLVFTNKPSSVSFSFCDRITKDLLIDPLVDPKDLQGLSTSSLHARIDQWELMQNSDESMGTSQAWKQTRIVIHVPLGKYDPTSLPFAAGTMVHRDLVDTISQHIRNDRSFTSISLIPHKSFVLTANGEERIYSHPMSCNRMIKEYEKMRARMSENSSELEWCIVGIQVWSDATKLANFGTHKLWPVYACLTHASAEARYRQESNTWMDLAYIPDVSLLLLTMSAYTTVVL